ncbi:MAG: hypothetical protein DRP60_06710 [Spirochaetes bacterium]|nr:MAG: hypothetical protein DRP60_06710 [Spirochaetota bacterium]
MYKIVFFLLIPKRNERSELVHSDGIVPRFSPPVRPLIRMSAGKAWFHTPRLCRGTGSRSSDSGFKALPWGMIPFILIFFFFPVFGISAEEPAWILLEKGKAELEQRNITESLDFLLQAVELNTDYPEAEYWLGRVYEAQGQAVLAEEQYRRALDLSIYLRVPQDRIGIEYRLAGLLLNLDTSRKAEALSILYGIADMEGASNPISVSLEHTYVDMITTEGIDRLLYLYRDELLYSLRARRILAEESWIDGHYRSSLLLSTRVVLSLLTTSSVRYRSAHPDWRFDIDEDKDRINPDRDVRFSGDSDGLEDMLKRIYSSDSTLSDWLANEGFWSQLYLLSVSLYAEGHTDIAESLWHLMVIDNTVTGELTPRPEAGKWGQLSRSQLREPFISVGSIAP